MATYAAYRHIELDNVGYSKKRVRNPSSEIFQVMCTPPTPKLNGSMNGITSPRRNSHSDSFSRLFGQENSKTPPRKASLTKQDVKNRNPVTGNGVDTWDSTPNRKSTSPRVHKERNPVTGEVYTIVSPAVSPTKSPQNGFAHLNGNSSTPMQNGNHEKIMTNGNHTNGNA